MNCQGCVYYRYEADTNFKYCTCVNQELQDQSINGYEACHLYYSIEDAKVDAKYGSMDKY
uniref:Uncharacterized protein n=1 Tax=viral metagenome TaxID=1070528 RepID=A0A6M3KW64_9ZZZZ